VTYKIAYGVSEMVIVCGNAGGDTVAEDFSMIKIHDGTIYVISRLRSGYFISKYPQYDDPTIIASRIPTIENAIELIKEDYKNDKQTQTQSSQVVQ
jgi:hypothetical protein